MLKNDMKNKKLQLPRCFVPSVICTVIFAVAPTGTAVAQDWRFEPILRVGGERDDNATLEPQSDQEVELSGLLLDASANIVYASPAASFSLQPRIVSRNYNDDPVFDSEDFYLQSVFRRQGPLGAAGFRFRFDDQSIRTAERTDSDLDIDDLDEVSDDDTGRVLRFGGRQKWRLSPYFDYRFSKVSSIGASLDYTDTGYDDDLAGLLTDYTDTRINLRYRRNLSDRTSGLIILTGRRYDSAASTIDVDGYGVSGGIDYALSEKTRVRAVVGIEDTDRPGVESDPEVVGYITLSRNLETIRLDAQYRRSVAGSGAGGVSTRDSLNLNFRQRLTERVAAGLGVRAYKTDSDNVSVFDSGNDYLQLHASATWYLSRSFVIEADFRHTVIDRGEDFGGRADSNRINLWFIYQPKTIPEL